MIEELPKLSVRNNLIGGSIPNALGVRFSNNNANVPSDNLLIDNIITGNAGYGVGMVNFAGAAGMLRNSLTGNRIYANGGIEIDIGGNGGEVNGVSANDPGDADLGPNNVQNFPVLSPVLVTGSTISIPYMIDSANVPYTLEFSFSTLCDASGNGPAGQMQSDPVALTGIPVTGTAMFQLPAVAANGFVTATATGPDGTSEFSACRPYAVVDSLLANGFE